MVKLKGNELFHPKAFVHPHPLDVIFLKMMLATTENVIFLGHNHRYWWPDFDYCQSTSDGDS